jgi:hypothetical protein
MGKSIMTRTAFVVRVGDKYLGQRRYSYREGTTVGNLTGFEFARIFTRKGDATQARNYDAESMGEVVPVIITLTPEEVSA